MTREIITNIKYCFVNNINMTDIGSLMKSASKMSIETAMLDEIFLDAAKDLVKDEVKNYIMKKIDSDPELKKEITEAIRLYMEAKIGEFYAGLKLTKSVSELSYDLIPKDIKEKLGKELQDLFEKNIMKIVENSF